MSDTERRAIQIVRNIVLRNDDAEEIVAALAEAKLFRGDDPDTIPGASSGEGRRTRSQKRRSAGRV